MSFRSAIFAATGVLFPKRDTPTTYEYPRVRTPGALKHTPPEWRYASPEATAKALSIEDNRREAFQAENNGEWVKQREEEVDDGLAARLQEMVDSEAWGAADIAAALDIVKGVAAMDPIVEYQGYTEMCCFCHDMKPPQWGGDGIGFVRFGDAGYVGPDHEPDCLWVRARNAVTPAAYNPSAGD